MRRGNYGRKKVNSGEEIGGAFFSWKVWSLNHHVSSVLPFLPGLEPKRRKGYAYNYCYPWNLSQPEEPESVLKAGQITLRWI